MSYFFFILFAPSAIFSTVFLLMAPGRPLTTTTPNFQRFDANKYEATFMSANERAERMAGAVAFKVCGRGLHPAIAIIGSLITFKRLLVLCSLYPFTCAGRASIRSLVSVWWRLCGRTLLRREKVTSEQDDFGVLGEAWQPVAV